MRELLAAVGKSVCRVRRHSIRCARCRKCRFASIALEQHYIARTFERGDRVTDRRRCTPELTRRPGKASCVTRGYESSSGEKPYAGPFAVARQVLRLQQRGRIANHARRLRMRRDDVAHERELLARTAHRAAGGMERAERLRAGVLVLQMQICVQQHVVFVDTRHGVRMTSFR